VTVVEMTPGLLPGADRDLVDVLAKRIGQTMKAVLLNTRVVEMKAEAGGIRVTFDAGAGTRDDVFDRVLVAVGRRPNASVPGLDQTPRPPRRAWLHRHRRADADAEPSIFAIGDVVGEPMLAHKASPKAASPWK
jgi:dihydrolipoamide dehydrogenase